MVTQEKIDEAVAKQEALLARMQEIDAQLGKMSPADPGKRALVSEKAEILPRYRGAKSHAKNLRRAYNSMADSARQVEHTLEDVVEDVDQEEMLSKLYDAMGAVLSDHIELHEKDTEAITDFMNWWEHTHEVTP